jgi:hypothetical protein
LALAGSARHQLQRVLNLRHRFSAADAGGIERAALDQRFEHLAVDLLGIGPHAQVSEAAERAAVLARRDNRLRGLGAHSPDRA